LKVFILISRLIREELAAARKELRDSGIRLITTSKAYFVNPNMKAAQNNRESAIKVNIFRIYRHFILLEQI